MPWEDIVEAFQKAGLEAYVTPGHYGNHMLTIIGPLGNVTIYPEGDECATIMLEE